MISDSSAPDSETSVGSEAERPRQFRLSDGLLVIAALAGGFLIARLWTNPAWCQDPAWLFAAPRPDRPPERVIYHAVALGGTWTIPCALTLTPVVIAARLLRPRPPFPQIAEQPGFVACAAAALIMVLRWSQEVLGYVFASFTTTSSSIQLPSPPFIRWPGPQPVPLGRIVQNIVLEMFPFFTAPLVGVGVLIAWLVLAANGRFRPAPDWVDRTGRALGIYWMALAVFTGFMSELWKFIG